jgi:hypothetical protein
LKVNRTDITTGLPLEFEAEIHSITPLEGTRLLLLHLDYEGMDLCVPVTRKVVAQILDRRGLVPTNPGEVLPVYTRKKNPGKSKKGPKVGTEKTINGVTKKLTRYDFLTPKLKGKRRVTCPETSKRGFPIWEKV